MKEFLELHEEDLERYFFNSLTYNGPKRYKLEQLLARYVESNTYSLSDYFMGLPAGTSFLFELDNIRDLLEDWSGEPLPDTLVYEIGNNWFNILSKTFVRLYVKYAKH